MRGAALFLALEASLLASASFYSLTHSRHADPDYHKDLPGEPHHSLTHPLDSSRVYWFWGGSTVVAKEKVRLTPSTADRRGFLWNDYPLESANWEVEFRLRVFSPPHFGGDGFGFWLVDSKHDPVVKSDPNSLSGGVFGMKEDFKGFGVIFDTYDNDGDRANPVMFVLHNPEGKRTNYNHDNDYQDDAYKVTPKSAKGAGQHSCTADYRKKGKTNKVLIRFLHQILHVYIDTDDNQGWRLCLAVEFEESFSSQYHLAFTAATGQVADTHEIVDLVTRYLSESEKDFDDTLLMHAEDTQPHSSMATLVWLIIFGLSLGLVVITAYEVYNYRYLSRNMINNVLIAKNLEQFIRPHMAMLAGLAGTLVLGLLFCSGLWLSMLCILPIAGWRGKLFAEKKLSVDPSTLGGHGSKLHGSKATSYQTRTYGILGVYGFNLLCVLWNFGSA